MITGSISPNESIHLSAEPILSQSQLKKQTYLLKILEAEQLNNNLKELYQNLSRRLYQSQKNSNEGRAAISDIKNSKFLLGNEPNEQDLQKKHKKIETEIQHMTHLLNVLISSNNKLKDDVNSSRNSRVIYSNVYKNLEKQIRKEEDAYKMAIVENLALDGAFSTIREKLHKIQIRCGKDLQISRIKAIKKKDSSNNEPNKMRVSLRMNTGGISSISQRKQDNGNQLQVLELSKKPSMKTLTKKSKSKLPAPDNSRYQAEEKSIYFEHLIKNLKNLSGLDSINEIIELYFTIQKQNQESYDEYQQLSKKNKVWEEKIRILQLEAKELHQMQLNREASKKLIPLTPEQSELISLDKELQIESEELRKMEEKVTQIIDINCKGMTLQNIECHFQRIQNKTNKSRIHKTQEKEKESQHRNLQKLLEKTQKRKGEDGHIMTQQEMVRNNQKQSRMNETIVLKK